MSRLFSTTVGLCVGIWLAMTTGQIALAMAAGLLALVLFELPRQLGQKRRLRMVIQGQHAQLFRANNQLQGLDAHLHRLSADLDKAVAELERRDSVGAPEARRLIKSQRETLQAQARALEEAQRMIDGQEKLVARFEKRLDTAQARWEEMVASMEQIISLQSDQAHQDRHRLADESGRLTAAFTEQSREMQRTMADLLHHLALEPRTSNVSVRDSVVMSEIEEVPRRVVGPRVSTRPSRGDDGLPQMVLKARPLPDVGNARWVEAFNEDLA